MNKKMEEPTLRSPLALAAVIGPLVLTIAWLVLGHFNTGYTLWGVHVEHYSAIEQQISALGVGNTGPLMNTAFIVSGALLIVGAVGIFRVLGGHMSPRMRRWNLTLWVLPGAGSIIDGIFTFEHFLPHFLGFGLSLMSVVAFTLTGIALRHSRFRTRPGLPLIVAGPLTLALTVWFFSTFTPTAEGQLAGIAGLTERILITEMLTWYVIVGWRAFRGVGDVAARAAVVDPSRRTTTA